MENLVLTDRAKEVLREAILDCQVGVVERGDISAMRACKKFTKYLALNVIPVSELEWVYTYYKRQEADLKNLTDVRLDGLKAEVDYMVNLLNDKYEFTEDNGMLLVELR